MEVAATTLGVWRLRAGARCLGSAIAIVSAGCLATLAVAGLALAAHGSPAWVVAPIGAGPVVYVLGRGAANLWRTCLVITTAEVVVVGVTRTQHVPLEDVEGFEPRIVHSGFGANGTPMIVLLRRGAAPIGVYALKREGLVWNSKKILHGLDAEAAELNLTLARARAGAGLSAA